MSKFSTFLIFSISLQGIGGRAGDNSNGEGLVPKPATVAGRCPSKLSEGAVLSMVARSTVAVAKKGEVVVGGGIKNSGSLTLADGGSRDGALLGAELVVSSKLGGKASGPIPSTTGKRETEREKETDRQTDEPKERETSMLGDCNVQTGENRGGINST